MNKILLIDDDHRLAQALRSFFEQQGYQVLVAHDGLAGLALAKSEFPDLILSDILVPGLNGFDLCRKVRQDPALATIPVILVTGVYKKTRYRLDAKECGANDFVHKPFQFSALLRSVETFLGPAPAPKDEVGELQQKLAEVKEGYVADLPAKIAAIESAFSEAAGKWSAESLSTLHKLAHGMAGSGGVFGFSALSGAAKDLELVVKTYMDSSTFPDAESERLIGELLAAIKSASVRRDERPGLKEVPIPAAPQPASERPRLIYLVEDDTAFARDLALQISYFGYSVQVIDKLANLPPYYKHTRPAAVVMDVMFPEGSLAGAEIIIQAKQRFPDFPPVVFMSSRGDLAARLMAVRAGGDAYFPKPVDVSELVDRLDSLTTDESPQPYRVLIVEDDSSLALHFSLTLKQSGIQTEVVTDPSHVMAPLVEFKPDLILMDIYMPGCTGIELASVIRQMETFVSIPIVFLSTETSLDKQRRALMLGGDGFLTKPVMDDQLVAAVLSRVKRYRTLRTYMVRDSLTGLYNHTRIKEQLAMEVSRSKRNHGDLSFAMIDLDHFKAVNDAHGHPAGDRVLKSLARLLQQRLRKSDIIGRYGGEEFAVILPDTDIGGASTVFRSVRESFEMIRHSSEKEEFQVTFSCGIASFPKCKDAARVTLAADKALYRAKREGRNRIVLDA